MENKKSPYFTAGGHINQTLFNQKTFLIRGGSGTKA
jgi:hypothetical protein